MESNALYTAKCRDLSATHRDGKQAGTLQNRTVFLKVACKDKMYWDWSLLGFFIMNKKP